MGEYHWKTSITKIMPDVIEYRGIPVQKIMKESSFSEAVFLLLTGRKLTKEEAKVVEAILISSLDHGPTPPSILSARIATSGGATMSGAVASGVLAIGPSHGGAVEDAMKIFLRIAQEAKTGKVEIKDAVEKVLSEFQMQKKRISGFGHRIHTKDPRVEPLFELAKSSGFSKKFIEIANSIEEYFTKMGKNLPINVDGAIAVILCELNVPPELANAFFIISRVVGIIAHYYEEKTKFPPMRVIDPKDFEYINE